MYQIYHTQAIVLGYKNSGDYDRQYTLLTKEHGIISAKAISVRKLASKSRYALTLFSHCELDLVRGKSVWRLTQARLIDSFDTLPKNTPAIRLAARISRLVRRMCVFEEPVTKVFDIYTNLLYALCASELSKDEVYSLELVSVLQILVSLGYVGDAGVVAALESYDPKSMASIPQYKKSILKEINRALKSSHM